MPVGLRQLASALDEGRHLVTVRGGQDGRLGIDFAPSLAMCGALSSKRRRLSEQSIKLNKSGRRRACAGFLY
jgi:hypothetical protein